MGLIGVAASGVRAKTPPADAGEIVSLPIVLPDEQGVRWDLQNDGSIADGGNNLYDGGGHLYLDNNFQFLAANTAHFSRERNEVTLGPISYRDMNISRRVAVNPKLGFCRWAEVFENTSAQKISVQLRVHFDMGGTIQMIQPYVDEKRNRQTIGMAIGDQRHCVGVAAAGHGSRIVPRFEPQQGGDQFNMYWELEIAPKQTAVIVHVQVYRQQFAAACAILNEIKDREYLAALPADLQKKVVNFRVGDDAIGDLEILRGELSDLIELRGGDVLRGRIDQPAFRLQTFYGLLDLPVDKVVSLINVGEFRPRQLLVMGDGEVFGVELANQVSSGPVRFSTSSLARMQFNSNIGEPDDSTPLMTLANGDILAGTLQGQLQLETSFDTLAISSGEVKRLESLKTAPADVQIVLWDDSIVQGQLCEPVLDFLSNCGLSVRIPASLIDRYLQPRPQPSENVIQTIKSLVEHLNADDWKQRDEAQEKLTAMGSVAIGTLKQLRLKESPEAQQRIDLIVPVLEKLARNGK